MPHFRQLQTTHERLRPWISRIQLVSADVHEAHRPATRLFPSLETAIVGCNEGYFSKQGENLRNGLFGFHDRSYRLDHSGSADRWSIHFFPGALAFFVRPPLNELAGSIVNSRSLFGKGFAELEERMGESQIRDKDGAAEDQDFLDHVESFLIRNYRDPSKQERCVYRLGIWIRKNLKAPIRERIERESGLSMRQLQRLFLALHGCSMSAFLRIARFERSIRLLNERRNRLVDVAIASGYYDQPHFIREFHHISCFTPTQYLSAVVPCDLIDEKSGTMSRSYNTGFIKGATVQA